MNEHNTFTPPNLPLEKLDWTHIVPLLGKAHSAVGHFRCAARERSEPGTSNFITDKQ